MTSEAERIPIGCDKLVYLPYLMGERTPHLDPDCRGLFLGLSAMHTKPHMIRAVMEGVAYSMRDCYEILKEMGVSIEEMLLCGGGGRSPLWRQMLADLYRCEVNTVCSQEGPALGVAILAGVGCGIFKTVQVGCEAIIKKNKPQMPMVQNSDIYEKYYEIYKSTYPAVKNIYKSLVKI